MGTRNITRVIADGEVRVNQYCQWDGYPSGRGGDVLKFMRDTVSKRETDRLLSLIRSSELIDTTSESENITYTGAPYRETVSTVSELVRENYGYGSDLSSSEAIEKLMEENKISISDAEYYMTASRDIGNDVLPFMLKHGIEGMTFYTDKYLSEIPPKGDWQIEGMFIINMDSKNIQIWWQGKNLEFDFSEIADMSDNDIEENMLNLEKAEQTEEQNNAIGGMNL